MSKESLIAQRRKIEKQKLERRRMKQMRKESARKKLQHRPMWTLREVKQALSFASDSTVSVDIGGSYSALAYEDENGEWASTHLPQLRKERGTAYSDIGGYEKRVDRFISKYGPDARFPQGGTDNQWVITPEERNDDDAQIKPSKESSFSRPENRCANGGSDLPSLNNPSSATADEGAIGMGHRASQATEEEEAFAKWDISLGGGKPGARPKAEPPSSPSQNNTYSASFEGDKVGFGPLPDASAPGLCGLAAPGTDRGGPSKAPEQSDKPGSTFRSSKDSVVPLIKPKDWGVKPQPRPLLPSDGTRKPIEPLGDVSSPLNSLSFGSFALFGAKGQRAWGLSNPSTKIKLSDLIGSSVLSTGLDESWLRRDGAGFSREDSFRNGNPGGYIDENKAQLEKKTVKGQARKIARHFVGFFRDNEVGLGAEQTPRVSGKKLIKELIGRATRLSRSKKEGKGAGLKLILVDISPSCEAIRDACFAAALAIADQDPNVVVLAHFNGYTATNGGHIVGHRQKEIPHIWDANDLEKFEAFLAKGKVSGAVCFGDDDASEVYALLSHYCPTLWMSPEDEDHCKWTIEKSDASASRVYDEARMYIIGGVHNAQSAVEGLKKLKEGR